MNLLRKRSLSTVLVTKIKPLHATKKKKSKNLTEQEKALNSALESVDMKSDQNNYCGWNIVHSLEIVTVQKLKMYWILNWFVFFFRKRKKKM